MLKFFLTLFKKSIKPSSLMTFLRSFFYLWNNKYLCYSKANKVGEIRVLSFVSNTYNKNLKMVFM